MVALAKANAKTNSMEIKNEEQLMKLVLRIQPIPAESRAAVRARNRQLYQMSGEEKEHDILKAEERTARHIIINRELAQQNIATMRSYCTDCEIPDGN